MGTKSKSTQWHLIVTLTHGITMPRVTHRDLTRGIFIFFKKIKKLKKKLEFFLKK